jgi:uncharacterized delta-60 repeat protein
MSTRFHAARVLRAALLTAAILTSAADAALAAAGDPDPAFDDDGRQVVPRAGVGRDVLLQPDGKIVVTGSTENGNVAVWRFNADGSPDNGFDGDGTAAVDLGDREEFTDAALQPDGKLVVAGLTKPLNGPENMAVVRFTANGSLDRTFNRAGSQPGTKILTSSENQRASSVVVQADGRIVLTGSTLDDYLIVRLDDSGAPDGTTYERDGRDGLGSASEAELTADGKLVVAGRGGVARFNTDGSLDKTFGTTGVGIAPQDDPELVEALLIAPDGKIVVAGGSQPADLRTVVTRLTPEGKPDPTFGMAGTASPDFAGQDSATGLALQDDGKLLVAGHTSAGFDFAVARLDANGVLDPSYGAGGKTTLGFDEDAGSGDAVLQPDGRLVISGATASYGVAVARLLGDPPAEEPRPDPEPVDPPPAPLCAGQPATIVGTPGSDTLRGTPSVDVIVARGGADRVRAVRGSDVVCGGRGRDRLYGGRGADLLLAGAGRRDHCAGGPARDRARGCEIKRSL